MIFHHLFRFSSATIDSNRSKRSSSYVNGSSGDAMAPGSGSTPKSSTPSRRSSSNISSPAPNTAQTPLTASVSNIINNYCAAMSDAPEPLTAPIYATQDKQVSKLSGVAAATNGHHQPTPVPPMAATAGLPHDNHHPKGSAYTSLLCYQNTAPPSPPSSLCTPKHAQKVITSSLIGEKLANLIDPEPVVKKRTKLRHRFSDVGSWGRKKKERSPKYHSIHIETLEVLGEPVVEDEFFVSLFFSFSFLLYIIIRRLKSRLNFDLIGRMISNSMRRN